MVDPDDKSSGVAPIHALIQFHPESGVLMLRGVSDTRPVKYHLDYRDDTILLYNKDKHVLFQKQNRFSLGKLDFCLHYESLDDEQYTNYVRIRNRALEQVGRAVPHPRLTAVPRKPHVKVDDMILHDNISSGSFGFVCAAVDAHTGAPVAMKEMWIRHQSMVFDKSMLTEREVSDRFAVNILKSVLIIQRVAENGTGSYRLTTSSHHTMPTRSPSSMWSNTRTFLHDLSAGLT